MKKCIYIICCEKRKHFVNKKIPKNRIKKNEIEIEKYNKKRQ